MAASSKKAIVAAIIADVGIAGVKFLGGALTASAVMTAEGIHSLVDAGNASLMLLGQRRAARPPDDEHPFGYGREVYFWTSVVAMLMFFLGGGFAVLEGVMALSERESSRWWMNYIVLGVAFVFDGVSLVIAVRELRRYKREKGYRGHLLSVVRKSHNPPIFITVLQDSAALAGVVIAAVAVGLTHALKAPLIDAIAAMLDGALLMAMGGILLWEAHGLIVGEAARAPLVEDAERIIRADDHIASLKELHSMQLGPSTVLLVLHARLTDGTDPAELARVSRDLESRLREEHPSIQRVLFDFD
jgi:cation diffusion facilitator family transporter